MTAGEKRIPGVDAGGRIAERGEITEVRESRGLQLTGSSRRDLWCQFGQKNREVKNYRTLRSNKRTATHDELRRYSSSAGVEKVLRVTATAPARVMPKNAEIHSGRFVIRTPTRVSLPTPLARSAHATSTARSHSSLYVQRVSPPAARKARASRVPYIDVTSRRNPGNVERSESRLLTQRRAGYDRKELRSFSVH